MLKKSILIFSSVALLVPQPLALHLLSTVFSHAQHDTSECVGPQISVQAEHHSLSEFQRHSFYVQHCQYKTSASCLSYSNNRKQKSQMNYY